MLYPQGSVCYNMDGHAQKSETISEYYLIYLILLNLIKSCFMITEMSRLMFLVISYNCYPLYSISSWKNHQNGENEHHRLVQANLALQNEKLENDVAKRESNHVTMNEPMNGTGEYLLTKNNNIGEVRFIIGTELCDVDKETVLWTEICITS